MKVQFKRIETMTVEIQPAELAVHGLMSIPPLIERTEWELIPSTAGNFPDQLLELGHVEEALSQPFGPENPNRVDSLGRRLGKRGTLEWKRKISKGMKKLHARRSK